MNNGGKTQLECMKRDWIITCKWRIIAFSIMLILINIIIKLLNSSKVVYVRKVLIACFTRKINFANRIMISLYKIVDIES